MRVTAQSMHWFRTYAEQTAHPLQRMTGTPAIRTEIHKEIHR